MVDKVSVLLIGGAADNNPLLSILIDSGYEVDVAPPCASVEAVISAGSYAAVIRADCGQWLRMEVLRLANSAPDTRELVSGVLALLKNYTGCEAVGIRLRDGDDYPYYATSGFPDDFLLLENRLRATDEAGKTLLDSAGNPVPECMCGNVINGRFDPSLPFFTKSGSFWTNSTSKLLANTTEEDRQARTRNRCHGEGYESVALVPLRSSGQNFGLMQFNDTREGMFTPETIALLEEIGDYVAMALTHRRDQDKLHKSSEELRTLAERLHAAIFTMTPDMRLIKLVGRVEELTGHVAEDYAQDPNLWFDLVHPTDRTRVAAFVDEMVASGTEGCIDFRIVATDGATRWIRGILTPHLDEDGQVVHIDGIDIDITDRKLAEDALARARKQLEQAYRREHHIADVLQHALIPDIDINAAGCRIVASYHAALDEAEVGGDFYDVVNLPNGHLALVMGDVSGKGLTAAVHTAMMKYMLRAYAHDDPSPGRVLERLNSAMCDYAPEDLFVTVFFGTLDPVTRVLTYADAGHDTPLHHLAADNRTTTLDVTGRAIGFLRDSVYGERSIILGAGDVLLLYTDGVTDSRSHGRFLGLEGLTSILVEHAGRDAVEIADKVFKAALKFSRGKQRDDSAVMVVKAV